MNNIHPHVFLQYEKIRINFIYSFSWDVTQCDFDDIVADSKRKSNSGWQSLYLYKRPVSWDPEGNLASYHPNIVSQNLRVLHKYGTIDQNAEVVIPIVKEKNKSSDERVKARLDFALRLYENGSGNCTFSFILDKGVTFKKIHSILHLASSVSFVLEGKRDHLTDAWLSGGKKKSNRLYPRSNKVSLTDLFNQLLTGNVLPIIWKKKDLWYDKKVIQKKSEAFHSWQTPYVVSILEISEADFEKFEDSQSKDIVKEIGSIGCRLSVPNDAITTEFLKLKREYIFNSFGYYLCQTDEKGRGGVRLKNYSHHSDLFYTIGKRGALAITPDLEGNPSYFAIPTLLNLIEILRSRWHLGSIVNLKLDELLERISHTKNLDKLQDEIFKCRVLYGLFLKNPAPYLFDGGAITEIAEAGEEIFWLAKLSSEMEKKFDVMDHLIEDIYTRSRFKGL